MDPAAEERLEFGIESEDHGDSQKMQYQRGGVIPALADDDLMREDDDYEELYDGVNVGEGFMQFHCREVPGSPNRVANGSIETHNIPEPRKDAGVSQNMGNLGVASDGGYHNTGVSFPEQKGGLVAVKAQEMGSVSHITGTLASHTGTHDASSGNMGFLGEVSMAQKTVVKVPDISEATNPSIRGLSAAQEMANTQMAVNANVNMKHTVVNDNIVLPQMENGPTMLFVGELHWWTTDADLENVLSHYGKVKEIKFFDERASGKSKGYCQVEFYDPASAAACKERMNGHIFNGRACVVTFASPQTLKQMGATNANKIQPQNQSQPQGKRNVNDSLGRGGGMNFAAGDGGRNYGRGGWGRGQDTSMRGPGRGGPRGRGPMGPRNTLGNAAGIGSGAIGNFGQGLAGPAFGGPAGGLMHPQATMGHAMMGPGFDPTYMGRGAGYGGFSGPAFPGMMPPFPAVNPMGLAGVAPHVNPAFFSRGMTPNGMGMMGTMGMEGQPGVAWLDLGMSGWGGDEHGQKTRESSYGGDDGNSDYGYGKGNPEKGDRSNTAPREKDRASDHGWSGHSERRYADEREQDQDRSARDRRYRDEKDGYRDNRQKERDLGYEDDWDRGQSSSRSRSRSRAMPEDDHRSRSRDVDYGKRRRAPSE